MNNTGVFDPNYALPFLLLLLLPTAFRVIREIILLFNPPTIVKTEEQPEQVFIPQVPALPTVVHANITTQKKRKPKKKKTKISKPDLRDAFGLEPLAETAETSKEVQSGAISTLKKLGFKASEARTIVKKMCINKCYESEEELLLKIFEARDE